MSSAKKREASVLAADNAILEVVRRSGDRPVKCRCCGCTETNACNPPCSWAPDEGNLCSSCAETIDALIVWAEGAVQPRINALVAEFKKQVVIAREAAAAESRAAAR